MNKRARGEEEDLNFPRYVTASITGTRLACHRNCSAHPTPCPWGRPVFERSKGRFEKHDWLAFEKMSPGSFERLLVFHCYYGVTASQSIDAFEIRSDSRLSDQHSVPGTRLFACSPVPTAARRMHIGCMDRPPAPGPGLPSLRARVAATADCTAISAVKRGEARCSLRVCGVHCRSAANAPGCDVLALCSTGDPVRAGLA